MDLGLDGKVALVMGASKGIGRGIAKALAREGAAVAVSSRSAAELEELASELGGGARAFPADSGELERMQALPGEIADAMGPVDIVVTNTGGRRAAGRSTTRASSGRPPTGRWCSRRGRSWRRRCPR